MSTAPPIPVPRTPAPSAKGSPVRRCDLLLGISSFVAALVTTPTVSTPNSNSTSKLDVISTLTDRRIVRATGRWVHSDIVGKVLSFLSDTLQGRHVQTIPIMSTNCLGLAVNATETLMAVSCISGAHKLMLYSLPSGDPMNTVDAVSDDDTSLLRSPQRVCFGPDDVIIVADCYEDCLWLYTPEGVKYQRSITVHSPYAVCVSHSGSMIGVGTAELTYAGTIVLIDFDSGNTLREFGHRVIEGWVNSIRFSPGDTHVIITSQIDCASLFAVRDGSFLRHLCHGISSAFQEGYAHDIEYTANGDIVVADNGEHCVCVYSSDGSELLHCFGDVGDADGLFQCPTALACVNGRLYVLNAGTPRVQVFE